MLKKCGSEPLADAPGGRSRPPGRALGGFVLEKRSTPRMAVAVAMALVFVASAMVVASTEDSDAVTTGWCGANVQYELDEGTLVLFGTGSTDGYGAFGKSPFGRNDINNVIIEDGITALGTGLFRNCKGLSYIYIPSSVTSFGSYLFEYVGLSFYDEGGRSLSVNPSSLSGHAYRNTGSGNMVRVSDSSNQSGTCGEEVKYSLDAYGTLMISGKGAMDDYLKYGAPWFPYGDIKSVIVGNGVTHIGKNAFYNCDSIGSVTINGPASVGDSAFRGCDGIKTVTFKGSCDSIGAWAFEGCSSLRGVALPDSVAYIGESSFMGCESLKTASLGNGGAAIWDEAFAGCGALSTVTIGGAASIHDEAFSGCGSLSKVTIGEGATHIGDSAFYSCFALSDLSLPATVTYIGDGAFYGCSKLTSLCVPAHLEYLGDFAFYPLELRSGDEVLDHTIESIGGKSFSGTDGVLLMEAETAVGDRFAANGLLYKVTSLDPAKAAVAGYEGVVSSVSIPNEVKYNRISFKVTSVAEKAFFKCSGLKSVDLGSVTTIGLKAFAYCSSLTSLSIPETVKSVGGYAFFSCGLTSLTVPGDDVVLGTSAFSACKSMKDIRFTGHGAVIGTNAFYNNNGVSSVDLSTVASVGFKAFPYCFGLTSVTIPSNISSVGDYAFFNCKNLKEIVLEDGVRKIGRSAFSGCKSLESVSLPKSLVYIGPNAFYGIKFLDEDGQAMDHTLKLRGHSYYGSGKVLRMADGLAVGMRFSAGGLDYIVTSADSPEARVTGFSGDPTSVPSSVQFLGCDVAVTSVADKALFGCSTLASADLSNVKSVGLKSFAYCTTIKEIKFGNSLSSVGSYAFFGLSFYDDGKKLAVSADALRGHAFSGSDGVLFADS